MSPSNQKTVVVAEGAPKAIGPYSAAVKTGSYIFTSGQIPIDPQTGEVVEGGIEAETRQVLTNLAAVLDAAGASLNDVVKTTVFLRDMNDFGQMNAVYATFFPNDPPARSAVQVGALPKNVAVEIEAVALLPAE